MNPYYFLEHQELPRLIYDKEMSGEGVAWIINQFEKLCVHILTRFGMDVKESDFTISGVRVRDGEKELYHIACLSFPFSEYPWNNLLCPRAYIVSETDYFVNPKYYTVEYDSGLGCYFLCGWQPDEDGDLIHPNYGTVQVGYESEMKRIKEMTDECFRSDNNTSG